MSNRFDILDAPLPGLKVVRRRPIGDGGGYLERLFCSNELRAVIADKAIVQVNRTLTAKRGTVRGMHFQYPPHTEIKLVSCLHGEVFDAAVDLRQGSRTFLQWHGEVLSAGNHKTLVISEGFAHGFQTDR
jgi:dTDP-4-dehydrorhamnose 3,5-epimerase